MSFPLINDECEDVGRGGLDSNSRDNKIVHVCDDDDDDDGADSDDDSSPVCVIPAAAAPGRKSDEPPKNFFR